MKIYIISLETAVQNRKILEDTMKKLNIHNYEIVNAVNGSEMKEFNIYKNWRDPWSHLHITKGEVGCALSHNLIWNKIVLSDEVAIVLEDDFVITNETDFCKLANYEGSVEFDLLYLGRKKMSNEAEPVINRKMKDLDLSPSVKILESSSSYWTIGYILSKKGAMYLKNGMTINSERYENAIFPVDEYIPWIFGKKSIYKLNDIIPVNTKYWTVEPPMIKPRNNAFAESGTYFSNPVPVYKSNLTLITVGTEENDCVKRYRQSCRRYGFNPIVLGLDTDWKGGDMAAGMGGGQKINFLKQYLSTIEENTLIVFTDSYDVIANNHVTELIDKYNEHYKDLIVFGAEKACWPDTNLKGKYPETNVANKYLNSGNFIGWSDDIKQIIQLPIENTDDDQLYYTHRFLESLSTTKNIALDYNQELFLCLNSEFDIKIEYNKSCVTINGRRPGFIHGNGPETTKLRLNRLSNYCVAGWNSTYGYKCTNSPHNTPKIMIMYEDFPEYNDKTVQSILSIDYPKDKIVYVYMYKKDPLQIKNLDQKFICVKTSNKLFETLEYLAKEEHKCDYVFYVNSNAIIENKNILNSLLHENKSVIGPLMKCKDSLLSNFWGDLDSNNFYKRSSDYIQIANRQRKGCWNVPYLWYALLIKIDHFESYMFTKNIEKGDGIDMAFCYNMRKKNYFMWVLNNEHFGYYQEPVSLFTFKTNLQEWEKRYLSKQFRESRFIEDLGSDILKVDIFTNEFCREVLTIAEQSKQWSQGGDKYYDKRIGNTENHPTQDIHLKQIGLEEMWNFIVMNYINKIVWDTYKYSTKNTNINFVVKYDMEKQKELRPHHDSSSYTVNICLNDAFSGGGCRFIRQNKTIINKDIGSLILHPGRVTHYHEGLPITEGTRYILVSFIN